ncbi:MAG: glycoside hydrolase family 3 C-terminal domain-containing protein [Anaerolineaceae bacterium]
MTAYLTPDQDAQVETWLSQLTLAEKISLLSGADNWSTRAIHRLGIPSLITSDGPHGVRTDGANTSRPDGPTTAYPTGVSMAATWDRELVRTLGAALAEETRAMGCDILLGPCVNIMRAPLGGRNFESYSEDPYLAGEIGLNWVLGLQSKGVGASLKHFACNNQETERMRVNVIVSERALREIYLPAFEKIVRHAQPWTVMGAYNRLNGTYACENKTLLKNILKDEWGFEGAVISDWVALHSTATPLNAGVDIEMPGPARWRGNLLKEAVETWQVEETALDDAVRRVLRLVARCIPGKTEAHPKATDTPEHRAIARQIARESITLLKNEGDLLPLKDTVRKIAVIGLNAFLPTTGGGSSQVLGHYWVTPLQGLQTALGERVDIRYEPGDDNRVQPDPIEASLLSQPDGSQGLIGRLYNNPDFQGEPVLKQRVPALDSWWAHTGPARDVIDPHEFSGIWEGLYKAVASGMTPFFLFNTGHAKLYLDDALVVENNSGDVMPEYGNLSTVLAGGSYELIAGKSYRLRVELSNQTADGFSLLQIGHIPQYVALDGHERAVSAAREADLAIVFAGNPQSFEREGLDRPSMQLPGSQDQLIEQVVKANPNTVVVINAGAPIEMPWADQVPAIVWAYYPGQEGGNALAEILTGEISPSGKLPMSLPFRLEDNPAFINYPGERSVNYGEGVFVGYRYYDTCDIAPRFAFGHGLSYTSFEYGNLQFPQSLKTGQAAQICFTIKNAGERSASEIAQVYVHDVQASVQRPVHELKGFRRVSLEPGEEVQVQLSLDERAFAFFDQDRHKWVTEPGYFEVQVGSSSRDIRLSASIKLEV